MQRLNSTVCFTLCLSVRETDKGFLASQYVTTLACATLLSFACCWFKPRLLAFLMWKQKRLYPDCAHSRSLHAEIYPDARDGCWCAGEGGNWSIENHHFFFPRMRVLRCGIKQTCSASTGSLQSLSWRNDRIVSRFDDPLASHSDGDKRGIILDTQSL